MSVQTATQRRQPTPRASLRARVSAHWQAGKLDEQLAVGVPAPAGSALAVRAGRLTSATERQALARTLRAALRDAHDPALSALLRVPLHRTNILAAAALIEVVANRLAPPRSHSSVTLGGDVHSSVTVGGDRPVQARGMARLHRLLADGRGPFYRDGRGDLTGRLGAAWAAL